MEMDLVDLDSHGPWPGDPEDSDLYEPDWIQIHPKDSDMGASLDWASATDRLRRIQERATGGFLVPPPDVLDALCLVHTDPLFRPWLSDLHSGVSHLRRCRRDPQSIAGA